VNSKFLVLKWDSIEEKLSDNELNDFYKLLNIIIEDESEEDEYCVFPKAYVDGYRKGQEFTKEENKRKRENLLKLLEELSNLKDVEIAHAEADEALLNFINDRDIAKAFEKIEKWYS
jgi:hypothetical protein